MSKRKIKGGDGNASQTAVVTVEEESRWLVGKSLLNGGEKLRPDLQELLDKLGVKVSRIVTDHSHEPMVCLKGAKGTLDALAAIAKGKVV